MEINEEEILKKLIQQGSTSYKELHHESFNDHMLTSLSIYKQLNYHPKFNVLFSDSIIHVGLNSNLFKSEQAYSIVFENCIFYGSINLDDLILKGVEFKNCYFLKALSLKNITFDSLAFSNCVFASVLHLNAIIANTLFFTGRVSWLTIESIVIPKVIIGYPISEDNFISTLRLNFHKTEANITLQNCSIADLAFDGEISSSNTVTINDSSLCQIHLRSLVNNGNLILANVDIKPIFTTNNKTLTDFVSDFQTFKSNTQQSSLTSFSLHSSILGNATFHNFDFTAFNTVNIFSSVIDTARFLSCEFSGFDKLLNIEKYEGYYNKKAKSKLITEVFRQFKHSFYKCNDFLTAEYFHTLEMHAYLDSLTLRKDRSKFIILILSKWSSNFGISLSRPLITFLVCNAIIFSCLILSNQIIGLTRTFNFSASSWNVTITSFIQFSNPLSSIDEYKNSAILLIGIIAMRIISSYCIYNFIRASRRFVK